VARAARRAPGPSGRGPSAWSRARALALAAALAPCACSKITYLPDNPIAGWSPPVVLMHRGGGNDCGPGLPCWPNTLPAVLHGFDVLDGAEVDIQLSADGTLWLGHDNEVIDCAGNFVGSCFQDLHDSQIDLVAYCDRTAPAACTAGSSADCIQHYVRAEEVIAAITGVPDKKISLDIKGQYCKSLGIADAQRIGDEVVRLVRTYPMGDRVLAESEQINFVDTVVGSGAPVLTFMNALGGVDRALGSASTRGADGISFKWQTDVMDADVVAGIHRKGFRVIIWTIDSPADIAAAWAAVPDVIESDNPDFFLYVTPQP